MNQLRQINYQWHGRLLFIGLLAVALLTACKFHHKKNSPKLNTYVVTKEAIHKTLYFTGIIKPLQEKTITSPIQAIVERVHHHYGELVHQHTLVFTLSSTELQKQYNETLTSYLKAKEAFSMAQTKFGGTEELWHAGLLSKNNYLSERSSFNNAHIALMQAGQRLTEVLELMGEGNYKALSALSLAKFDKVRLALTAKHDLIYLRSPAEGILLYPPKSGDETNAQLMVGSTVKAGQVLALVGDLRGVRVDIDVPEVDIDKIHINMPALVHSTVFPQDALRGRLIAINPQASTHNNSALPSFSAVVQVKELTAAQQAWVKVGMSATIELPIDVGNKLVVPIAAIKLYHGSSQVMVEDKPGQFHRQTVKTGTVLENKVIIESGLNVGDVIVYSADII